MIHSAAVNIGEYMALVSESDEERKQVLIYSVEILLSYLVLIFNISVISIGLNILIPELSAFSSAAIYIITFIFIRRYFGGYHAKSSMVCLILSTIIPIGAVFLRYYINFNIFLLISIYTVCFIIAVKLGTVDNPNKRLSDEEKSYFKSKGLRVLVIIFIINMGVCLLGFQEINDIMLLATIYGFGNLFFGR